MARRFQPALRLGLALGLGLSVALLLLQGGGNAPGDPLRQARDDAMALHPDALMPKPQERALRDPVFPPSASRAGLQPAEFLRALPPDGTPVDQVIAALAARARAGDARAACRIGSELQRCQRMEHWEAYATHLPAGELPAERRQAILAEGRRLIEDCARVAPSVQKDLPRYHLVAALQGNPHSAAQFAGAAVTAGDLVRDPQLYALYRAHAWRLFELAFEAGHPDALETWSAAVIYSDSSARLMPLWGVMPDAWRRPELAGALMMRVHRPGPVPIDPGQSAGARALQQEAEQIYQTRFANARWQGQHSTGVGLAGADRELHVLQDAHRLRPCDTAGLSEG